MIKTIRTWINRIRNYDEKLIQIEKLQNKLAYSKRSAKERLNELERLASLLSGNTWKKGDNMMESIEAYQQEKYLKEHAEDFLMIMNGNVPEMAAQELFEYFEIEMPQSEEIEDKTARALHQIWCNWYLTCDMSQASENNVTLHKRFEELSEKQKNKYREDARYLWYTGHQKQ